jgi:hypothetical protein
MTDRSLDEGAFERALRGTLGDLAPGTTPASLRAAVAAVPRRSRGGVAARGRALFATVGIAAAVVVAAVGIGMVVVQRAPDGGLSPVGTPVPATPTPVPASPTPATETLTFRVVAPAGSTASKTQVLGDSDLMAARLTAYGIGNFSSSASGDRITFEVPVPPDSDSGEAIRSLLGRTGAFAILQPVATPPAVGDHVSGAPLVIWAAMGDSNVGRDQAGNPTLDLVLVGPGAATFTDVTTAHVGDYLPIALDGVAIAVPYIEAPIRDGQVQVPLSSNVSIPVAQLAAILHSGPLLLPVEVVTP